MPAEGEQTTEKREDDEREMGKGDEVSENSMDHLKRHPRQRGLAGSSAITRICYTPEYPFDHDRSYGEKLLRLIDDITMSCDAHSSPWSPT